MGVDMEDWFSEDLLPEARRTRPIRLLKQLEKNLLCHGVHSIWTTSVAFDPVMEAYANYGYIGVVVLAVVMGFFLGWVTRLTIHVPMLSFGFMFGVLVIGTTISGWNTMGVFVTSLWQSFLALAVLSMVLMSKENNPVWKYYAMKLAEKLRLRPDPKLTKTLDEVSSVLKKEDQSRDIGYGISDIKRDSGVQGGNFVSQKETGLAKKHVAVIRVWRPDALEQDSRHRGNRFVAGGATQTPSHHAGPSIGSNHPACLHSLAVFQNHPVVVGTFDPHAGKERNPRGVGHDPSHLFHEVAVMKRQADLPVHIV